MSVDMAIYLTNSSGGQRVKRGERSGGKRGGQVNQSHHQTKYRDVGTGEMGGGGSGGHGPHIGNFHNMVSPHLPELSCGVPVDLIHS